MDYNPPGSSVHGIFQARILEWVAIYYPRGSSQPGIEPTQPVSLISPALADEFFTTGATWEAHIYQASGIASLGETSSLA